MGGDLIHMRLPTRPLLLIIFTILKIMSSDFFFFIRFIYPAPFSLPNSYICWLKPRTKTMTVNLVSKVRN